MKTWLNLFPQIMYKLQANLFQKHLFLHQLTHNMTKDCSWNYRENYKHRTWGEHVLPIFCACSFHGNSMNNLLSYCGLIDAKIRASDRDLPVLIKKCFRISQENFTCNGWIVMATITIWHLLAKIIAIEIGLNFLVIQPYWMIVHFCLWLESGMVQWDSSYKRLKFLCPNYNASLTLHFQDSNVTQTANITNLSMASAIIMKR